MIRHFWAASVALAMCTQIASAQLLHDEDFSLSDGGYTVSNEGGHTDPWAYDAVAEAWSTDGSENGSGNQHTRLTSPDIAVTGTGEVYLSFDHLYSIEGGLWDGGAVFTSINGGAFTQVPGSAFTLNGYNANGLIGNHALNGGEGFGGNSPGYPEPIPSTASLGVLSAGDTLAIQFLMANDEFSTGEFTPNWQINSVTVRQAAIPEPTTAMLLVVSSLSLGLVARRRK